MKNFCNIAAVIFDMDGTLVDSELLTGPTIEAFCNEMGVGDVDFHYPEFYGASWASIERRLVERYPELAQVPDIPKRLNEIFHAMGRDKPPAPINGAKEFVIAAHERMPTAIISSSYRETIEQTIRHLGIEAYVTYYAGADDYANPKPAPDGYLKAAEVLNVEPDRCLVFEDSLTGLRAAKAAGMPAVLITHRCHDIETASKLADRMIRDYSELDADFFNTISRAG